MLAIVCGAVPWSSAGAGPDPLDPRRGGGATATPFRHVEHLAGDIGPRPAGSPGDRQASRYVESVLESNGCTVVRQSFALPQGGRSRNVVGVPAAATAPPALLVGAHIDTVQGSPGGNDNASGVAALLGAAEDLCASDAPIALVGFGAEEFQPGTSEHHVGSDAYVERMTKHERAALVAMVSVDMVGKLRPYIVARLAGTRRGAAELLADAVRDAGFRARVRVLGDISDHGPFARARMPAAFLWTGDEPNHHEPTDRVRNVDPAAVDRGVAVLNALVDRYEAGT